MEESLSKEQIAALHKSKKEWLKIGLSNKRANRKRAEGNLKKAYEVIGMPTPENVYWVASPTAALAKYKELTGEEGDKSNFCYGAHSAHWLGFYDFFLKNFDEVDEVKKIKPFIALAKDIGWWLPYEKFTIISERPVAIHVNDEIKLHKDGGPAIEYEDGDKKWALHGVEVPQEVAELPGHKIPIKYFLSEKNVEVRREIFNKMGCEKVVKDLDGVIIDQQDIQIGDKNLPYKLWEVTVPNADIHKKRRALEMLNPSLEGIYHMEWVPPHINTCEEALKWRNQEETLPEVLT